MLARISRILLRKHFQILGSYFLPHTNTEILLDSNSAIIKETGLFSPGLPKLNYQESVRVNIGFPVVRTDGRSFGRCTVKWIQNFLGWVRFTYPWCSAGARENSSIIKVNYLIHWMEWKQVDIAILHKKLGYLLNLDLCCVSRECLLFLSLKLTGERLGNRLKHCFKWVSDTSVLGTFVLTLPLYACTLYAKLWGSFTDSYTCIHDCLRTMVVVISIISNWQ